METRGTIIIPQRGATELTLNCIASLRKYDTSSWPIVVVSDGCPDGDRSLINREFERDPLVTVLNRGQEGVTASWNAGATIVETAYFILLNNDTICEGDWGEAFIQPLKEGRTWISGIRIREESEISRLPGCRGISGRLFEGWCLGICQQTWKRLGGFDETLRTYWSDTDYQLRGAMLQGGWSWLQEGMIERLPILHLGHRTAHRSDLLRETRSCWARDRRSFQRKWRGILRTARLPVE